MPYFKVKNQYEGQEDLDNNCRLELLNSSEGQPQESGPASDEMASLVMQGYGFLYVSHVHLNIY